MTVSGAVTQTAGTASLVTDISGDITISANVGGGATTTLNAQGSIVRTAGTVSGTAVNLTAVAGSIGTDSPDAPIITDAANSVGQGLTLNATTGSIFVTDANAVRLQASTAGNKFIVKAGGTIVVDGTLTNGGAADFTLQTTAGGGAITLNANINAAGVTRLFTQGGGNIGVTAGVDVNSAGHDMYMTANDVNFAGAGTSINPGRAVLFLSTNGNKAISVGGAGGVFVVTGSDLANIKADVLSVSDGGLGGGITIAGPINVSAGTPGTTAGAYDLEFHNAGNYTSTGQTITLGSRTLNVNVGGTLNTGTVTGGSAVVTLTSVGLMTISVKVTVTSLGTVQLLSTGSNITLSGDVGGGTTTSINANSSIIMTAGTVSGNEVILTAVNGSIGTSSPNAPIVTNAGTGVGDGLDLHASNGSVYVSEVDAVRIQASTALNDFVVTAVGNIDTSGIILGNVINLTTTSNGNITIGADIGNTGTSSTTLTANNSIIRPTTGTVFGTNVFLTGQVGAIGTDLAPIVTEAGSLVSQGLTLNALNFTNGFIYVRDLTAVRVQASTSGNYFQLRAAGAITVDGVIANDHADGFLVETTAANGHITLNANLVSDGGTTLATNGTGNIILAPGVTLSSNNNQMLLIANDIDFGGIGTLIDAGTNSVTMRTNGSKAIVLAGAGGVFNLSPQELANIRAVNLIFGDNSGGITIAGAVNVATGTPGTNAGAYNLSFTNNNNFTAAGQSIILGTRTLTVDVNGTLDTGTITGTNTTISLTAGTGLTVSGGVTMTGGSISLVTDTSGDINIGANVGGGISTGATTTVNARGSIVRTSGTISGAIVNLTAVTGSIGTGTPDAPIVIDTDTSSGQGLTATAVSGSVYVTEQNNLRVQTSQSGGAFVLKAGGNITTQGVISNGGGGLFVLETTAGNGTITLNANLVSTGPTFLSTHGIGDVNLADGVDLTSTDQGILLRANNVSFGGTGTSINAGNGNVGLQTNGNKAIVVAGAGGVFNVSSAELLNITADTLEISDNGNGGGITIAGAIDVSPGTPGTTAGSYNLMVINEGNYTALGQTITLGLRSLNVDVDGTLSTGTVTAGNTFVTLTAGTGLTVSGNVSVTGTGTIAMNTDASGDIVISADVVGGDSAALTAFNNITRTAGTVSGVAVYLTANNGSIGTGSPDAPIVTEADGGTGEGLTLTAANGSIFVADLTNVRIQASSSGGAFVVKAGGTITTEGLLANESNGVFTLETTANNGAINLNANVSADGAVNLITIGTGDVDFAAGVILSSTNDNILMRANDVSFGGTGAAVNAGSGNLNLRTNGNKAIAVAGAGGVFNVSSAELDQITAGAVSISDNGNGGGITIAGAIDVSVGAPGTDAGAYNLDFGNTGNYTAAGHAIILGSRSLTVNVGGTINTGSVAGTSSIVSLTAGTGLTVSAGVTVTSGTVALVTSTSGNITISADVGGGSLTTINANNSIIRTSGTVFGTNVTLTAVNGAIGTDSPDAPIVTDAGSNAGEGLTLNATDFNNGFIFVRDLNAVRVQASTSGNFFRLRAAGAITVDGVLANGHNDGFILETTAASGNITLNANLISDGGTTIATHASGNIILAAGVTLSSGNDQMLLIANDVDFGGIGTLIDAGSNSITMRPNGNKAIVLAGAGGVFNLSSAELANIRAVTLLLGNNSGGITIAGAVDVSAGTPGTTAGAYNLNFTNNNNFTAAGQTITLGSRTLTIDVNGTLNTGTIGGGNTTISLTGGTGMTVSGNVTLATGTTTLTTNVGGSITISADVGGGNQTTVNSASSIFRTAGTVIGTNVSLIANSGSIGTISPDAAIVVDAGSSVGQGLTLTNSSGDIAVADVNSVLVHGARGGGNFVIRAAGSITSDGELESDLNFTIETTAANGSINLNDNLLSDGEIILKTHGTGNVNVADGFDVISGGNDITIQANNVDFDGIGTLINAGSASVSLLTNGNKSIVVSGAGGTFNVSGSELARIIATTLNVSDDGNGGGLTIGGSISVGAGTPGTTPGSYNLSFANANNFTSAGQTFTLGTKTLTVLVGGTLNIGTINANVTTVSLTAGTGLSTSGNITVAGGSTVTLQTTNLGDITLSHNVGHANGTTNILADGSIVRTAGTISGSIIQLTANNGSVGANTAYVFVDTGTAGGTGMTVVATNGSAYLSENGAGRMRGTSTISDTFMLEATGSLTLAGTVAAEDATISVFGLTSDITIAGDVTGTNSLTMGAANSILRNSGTLTGTSITLSATNGNIGADTASGQIVTEAGSGVGEGLTLSAFTGEVFLRDLSAVALQLSASQFTFRVRAAGAITVEGEVSSGNGNLTLETTESSFSINVNANVFADQILTLITNGSGALIVASGVTVESYNSDIEISARDVSFGGAGTSIRASFGGVNLQPNDPSDVSIGGTTSTFSLTQADLANITAETVSISDPVTVNNINIVGPITIQSGTPGTTAGAFNLVFLTANGNYNGSGQTITINDNDLTITTSGTLNTGNLTGTTGNVIANSGSALSIGNINVAGGTLLLSSGNNGNIQILGNITGSDIEINANGAGTITRTGAFLITSPTLDLISGTGDIGQLALPILVSVDNLFVNTAGSVHVLNDKNLTLAPVNIGGSLFLTVNGTLTNGMISAQNVGLVVSTLNNGVFITATNPAGIIDIAGFPGQGLTVTGGGNLVAPGGATLTADNGLLRFAGNQNIDGNGVIDSLGGTGLVDAALGTSIFASGDLTVNATLAILNQPAFTAGGTLQFNIVNPPAPTPTPTPTTTESTFNLFSNFLSSVDTSANTISSRNDPVIIPTDQNQGSTGNSLSIALATDLTTDSFSTLEWGNDNDKKTSDGSVSNLAVLSQNPSNTGSTYNIPPGSTVNTGDIDLSAFTDLISISSPAPPEPYKKVAYTHPIQATEPAASALQSTGQKIKVGAARSNLIVFTAANQVTSGFVTNNTDSILSGTTGTVVTTDKNIVVVHTGRLLADNGKQPITVFTNQAAVTIGADSAAVIDVHPGAPVRVMSVAGNSPISVRTRDGSRITLSPGQEVIVGQTDLSDSDLLPTDGVNRNSNIQKGKIARDNFSLSEFLNKDDLVDNHARLQGHIASAVKKQSQNKSTQSAKLISAIGGQPARILAEDDTEFTIKQSGQLRLYKGALFVHSNDELAIETPLGQVHETKGIALRVTANNGKSRVQVLSGTKPVSIIAGKHIMPLKCGKEMLITNHKPTQQETAPADEIGRRGMEAIALENGLGAVLGDFSIFSVLTSAKYMLPLCLPTSVAEQRIHTQIIKSAAVIQHVFGGKGRYYVAPKEQSKITIPDWVFKSNGLRPDNLSFNPSEQPTRLN